MHASDDPLLPDSPPLYFGHSLRDWLTCAILSAITITLIVVMATVLPSSSKLHPCAIVSSSIINRMKLPQSKAFNRIQYLADVYGPRVSGAGPLESAHDWILRQMKEDNITAWKEPVSVTRWTRGLEQAFLKVGAQQERPLKVLGLVGTVGANNLSAGIVLVSEFDGLVNNSQARGKIVVFNQSWTTYEKTLEFARRGAVEAAKAGAIGCLVQSITPFSLGTIHVATVDYKGATNKIPCATITLEDAALLQSLYANKQLAVSVRLDIAEHVPQTVTSYNIVAEIEGVSRSNETVVISASLDSSELGQGVQDSLVGYVMAWEGLRVFKFYNTIPARTIRLVGWTGTETGNQGAKIYVANSLVQTVFALQANKGSTPVTGLSTTILDSKVSEVVQGIAKMLEGQDAGSIRTAADQGNSPLSAFLQVGVPVASFQTEDGEDKFHWYSKSEADTLQTVDVEDVKEAGGVIASYSYCIADTEEDIRTK